MADEIGSDQAAAILPWLFPATFLVHIAEEYWGGGGYSAYMARARGVNLPPSRFLLMNGFGLGLMTLGVLLARKYRFTQWLVVCLGALVLGNGLSHTINGVVSREYNPGLVSGLLIWIPLGLVTLVSLKAKMVGRRYWTALCIGIGIQVVVALLAMTGGKPLSFLSR
jgi:hypothetical protein